jgi:hypothetical protein
MNVRFGPDRANQVSREADIAALAGLAPLGFFTSDDGYASVLTDPGKETADLATGGEQALAPMEGAHGAEDAAGQG